MQNNLALNETYFSWAQAEIMILSQHPYLLHLLHYPPHSLMVGLWRSEIQNPLFLDSDCNVNPAAELRKTLEALFSISKYSDFNV